MSGTQAWHFFGLSDLTSAHKVPAVPGWVADGLGGITRGDCA